MYSIVVFMLIAYALFVLSMVLFIRQIYRDIENTNQSVNTLTKTWYERHLEVQRSISSFRLELGIQRSLVKAKKPKARPKANKKISKKYSNQFRRINKQLKGLA